MSCIYLCKKDNYLCKSCISKNEIINYNQEINIKQKKLRDVYYITMDRFTNFKIKLNENLKNGCKLNTDKINLELNFFIKRLRELTFENIQDSHHFLQEAFKYRKIIRDL